MELVRVVIIRDVSALGNAHSPHLIIFHFLTSFSSPSYFDYNVILHIFIRLTLQHLWASERNCSLRDFLFREKCDFPYTAITLYHAS